MILVGCVCKMAVIAYRSNDLMQFLVSVFNLTYDR